jgi:hypothetical protein
VIFFSLHPFPAHDDNKELCPFQIFTVLFLVYYTLDAQNRFLVEPVMPEYTDDDFGGVPSKNISAVAAALSMTGEIMQLILNHRAQVFAGRYKAAVVLGVFVETLSQVASVTWFVGPSEVMAGISYGDVLWSVFLGVPCWQAWRYSSRIPEDEHAEDVD